MMTAKIENSRASTGTNKFSKKIRYKSNTQKFILYTTKKEFEISKMSPFTTAPKNIKYLGINLTKDV